jgi:DNA invertase Pin-like site-specific DNA recombinase
MSSESESKNKKPKVVSYLRWSTPGQKLGDSEKRQIKAANEWLEENGYELDESLVIEDDGKSGYHSENFSEDGALGQFAKKVKQGKVERGTILLIEDFSRFSRARVSHAQERFLSLVNNHIVIHILRDNKTYKNGGDFSDFFLSMVKMQAAHEESARKADHLKSVWQNRRLDAQNSSHEVKENYPVYLPSNAPDWLRKVKGEGKLKYFEVIEERRKVIEHIFHLADQGGEDGLGLGSTRIVRILDQEGIEPFVGERKNSAKTFNDGYITRLLGDRRLIGEIQPYTNPMNEDTGKRIRVKNGDPIPNYFPPIIPEEVFDRVRQKIEQRKMYQSGKVSRKFSNIFTKIGKCSYCGSSMTLFTKKGSKAEGGRSAYLQCSEGTKLADKERCGNRSVRYFDTFEKTIIKSLSELDLEQLFQVNDQDSKRENDKIRSDIFDAKTRLSEIGKKLKNVSMLMVEDPDDESFVEIKEDLKIEKINVEESIQKLNQELLSLNKNHNVQVFKDNLEIVLNSFNEEDEIATYSKRRAINTYLLDILQYIAIDGQKQQAWIVFDLDFFKERYKQSFDAGMDLLNTLQSSGAETLHLETAIPSEAEIKAFGTSPIQPHIRIELRRFKDANPTTEDVLNLRESFEIAPRELVEINDKINSAINRNWRSLKRTQYQVLDIELETKLKDEAFPFPELLEGFEE